MGSFLLDISEDDEEEGGETFAPVPETSSLVRGSEHSLDLEATGEGEKFLEEQNNEDLLQVTSQDNNHSHPEFEYTVTQRTELIQQRAALDTPIRREIHMRRRSVRVEVDEKRGGADVVSYDVEVCI